MALVTSFVDFVQPLAVVMTTPTWGNFQVALMGWVAVSRRTITGMIEAAGHSIFLYE